MRFECPGSSKFKHPQPEEIKCPGCGEAVEIWTDEVQTKCPRCETVVSREQGQSCLDWCKYAKECVGEEKYSGYLKNKRLLIKDKLIHELEVYFDSDTRRIEHAKKVLGFAEEMLCREESDWRIVIPAAILHDVGIKIAEQKYGSSAGNYQEKEGPQIARGILNKLNFKKEDIEEICDIIGHHHSPGVINTQNFKVLYDADWLVNLRDEVVAKGQAGFKKIIDKVFLTKTGKEIAERIYAD